MRNHRLLKECCGQLEGRIEPKNGQNCVYCIVCGKFNWNAPKTETGEAVRSIATAHEGISVSKRARVLARDSGRCVLCGKEGASAEIQAGHLLSVKDGLRLGLSETEINDDENLSAMCAECNSGLSASTVPMRLLVNVLLARLKNKNAGGAA